MKQRAFGANQVGAGAAAFAPLARAAHLSLTTYRRTGEGVATPVWFAERDGTLYVRTWPGAGKVKRIAHSPRVVIAACTMSGKIVGAAVQGRARVLTTAGEEQAAERALARKYRLVWWAYFGVYGRLRRLLRRAGVAPTPIAYLAICPTSER